MPVGGTGALDELHAIAERCRALANTTWRAEPATHAKEAVVVLEAIQRSLSALRISAFAEIERAGSWSGDGERTMTSWITNRTGSSRGRAARGLGMAKALTDDLPGTRDALANGEISEDHVQVLVQHATKSDDLRNRLKDPDRGERALLEQAQKLNATDFAKVAKGWATQHDPKGADRQWRRDLKKEELHVVAVDHGTRITGWLTTANGALLLEALESHMGRKGAEDMRQFPERQAAGLVSLAQESLNLGVKQTGARIRPQLTITMG